MRTFTFETQLILRQPPAEVFSFFGDAGNLEILTPPWLHFHIITPRPIAMQVGATIDYRLRVHGLPIFWRTLISGWEPPFRFVDEQVHGPYWLWEHEHTFEPHGNGTLARDHIRYRPMGGALMNRLFVRHDIEQIFAWRTEALRKQFGPA